MFACFCKTSIFRPGVTALNSLKILFYLYPGSLFENYAVEKLGDFSFTNLIWDHLCHVEGQDPSQTHTQL